MAAPELAILDGRYQLIRQLSGPAHTPLMIASDLQRGKVVCLRLQRFNAALASLAAVPPLAYPSETTGDGPLLPYEFGVDDGISYVVRDFVTAKNLAQLQSEADPPGAREMVSIFRRTGEALLEATARGFHHPGLEARHILITATGTVHLAGYDQPTWPLRRVTQPEEEMLVALLLSAFGATPPDALSPSVRSLRTRMSTWQKTGIPHLEVVVRQLRRTEDQLAGRSGIRTAVTAVSQGVSSLIGRLIHLGPLVQPYLAVLALVLGIVTLAARAVSATNAPATIYVYPAPTRASSASDSDTYRVVPAPVFTTTSVTASSAHSATLALPQQSASLATTTIARVAPVTTSVIQEPSRRAAGAPFQRRLTAARAVSSPAHVLPFRRVTATAPVQRLPVRTTAAATQRRLTATATTVTAARRAAASQDTVKQSTATAPARPLSKVMTSATAAASTITITTLATTKSSVTARAATTVASVAVLERTSSTVKSTVTKTVSLVH